MSSFGIMASTSATVTTESQKKDNLLKLYRSPNQPGAFRGIKGLQSIAAQNDLGKLSIDEARRYLEEVNSYSLHGRVLKGAANLTERVISSGPYDLWEADLATPPRTHDGQSSVVLMVIDVFTKFLMARVLANKSGKVVGDALKQIVEENVPAHVKLNALRTDQGKEFLNTYARKNVYKALGINHYIGQKEPGACIVERVIRTLMTVMQRYVTENPGISHADLMTALPDFVAAYNGSVHTTNKQTPQDMQDHAYNRGNKSGLQILQNVAEGGQGTVAPDTATPAEVAKEKEGDRGRHLAALFQSTTMGRNKRANPWDPVNGERIDQPLATGKLVRMVRRDNIIRKGSRQKTFTDEVFKVIRPSKHNPNAYYLQDDKKEEILGKVYRRQLQGLTKRPEEWHVRVIGRPRTRQGRKEILVEWVGHPHLPREWIPAADARP